MDQDDEITRDQGERVAVPVQVRCADAALQTFIDRVVIPALLDRLLGTEASVGPSTASPELSKSAASV